MNPRNSSQVDPVRRTLSRDEDEEYRWTCPFCGKARTNRSRGAEGRENALAALRTHVVASEGNGHGPRHEHPHEEVSFSEFVARVDDREGTGRAGR